MSYPGGKSHCFQQIINLIPPHRVYIETHLGGGGVLRRKTPAIETYGIDRDPSVIQNFRDKFDASFSFINATAEEWLNQHKFSGDEFIYADPPYLAQTRRAVRSPYRYQYSEQDHINLLSILNKLPCPIMISGYRNSIYDQLLGDWNSHDFNVSSRMGQRVETVWINYQVGVVHDARYLGRTFRERQSIKRRRERWVKRFQHEPCAIQQALLSDLTHAFHKSQSLIHRQTA